jgi:hypothetical protein
MGDVSKELIDPNCSVKELSNFKSINVPEALRPATQIFLDSINEQKQLISQINPTQNDMEKDLDIIDQVTNAIISAVKRNGECQKDAIRNADTQFERQAILMVSAASTAFLTTVLETINYIFTKVIDFIQRGYRRVKDAVIGIFETIYSSVKDFFNLVNIGMKY